MAEIEVRGLREVQLAFRQIDKEIPKGLRAELLPIAGMVVAGVQQKVPFVTGAAARSVRPRASQRGAGIAFGGNAAPYFPWLDFGGTTGKGHRPGQRYSGSVKREWLGRPADGRYVYPTIEEHRDEIEKAVEEAVVAIAKRIQFEVT